MSLTATEELAARTIAMSMVGGAVAGLIQHTNHASNSVGLHGFAIALGCYMASVLEAEPERTFEEMMLIVTKRAADAFETFQERK